MKYLIIGLGIYGSNLALDLTAMGHEVIGADSRANSIEALKDYISAVYQVDCTDENALSVLPLKKVDVVIVAIGENFGASVKTVALLKKLSVPHIFARAIDTLHESILQTFHIDRILTPEQRAASDLTNELALGSDVVSLKIDRSTYVLRFQAPQQIVGLEYASLPLAKNGLKLVAVSRPAPKQNILGLPHNELGPFDWTAQGSVVQQTDTLTVLGSSKAFRELFGRL